MGRVSNRFVQSITNAAGPPSATQSSGLFSPSSQSGSNHPRAKVSRTLRNGLRQLCSVGLSTVGICLTISCLAVPNSWAQESSAESVGNTSSDEIQFNRDVRPILNQHCVACHGGVQQAADLSFVYEDQALSVIEPGSADDSYLFERIVSEFEDERMPPPEHGPALADEQIEIIRKWIDQGAKWGGHWAFEAPTRHELPTVSNKEWPRQRLDHFVLAKLEQAGLKPNGDANPRRWLRRVSLDLIGIPPTLDEQQAFLEAIAERGEDAYGEEVDRLLASPHFGERWASVWLDLVRYADSKGLGQDGRRTIWKYRDWVIESFNKDLPYDEFTIKQLAGDLLPNATIDDQIATACHRTTQTNEEGGTDDEEFRIEALIDRTNTTWQTWQGLTFGCVQCHNHPYEPIKHDEYYKFLAYFNNTQDTDLSSDAPKYNVPLDSKQYAQAEKLDRAIDDLVQADWRESYELLDDTASWNPLNGITASTQNETQVVLEKETPVRTGMPASDEYHTVGTVARNTTITIESKLPEGLKQLTAIRFDGLPLNPEVAMKDSEWGFVMSSLKASLIRQGEDDNKTNIPIEIVEVIGDEPFPLSNPRESLNVKSAGGFGAYSRINYPRKAAFLLKESVAIQPGDSISVAMNYRIVETGAFPLVARRGRLSVTGSDAWLAWRTSETRQARLGELSKKRDARRQIRSVSIPVMKERYSDYGRHTYVFDRGNFLNKSDLVAAQTPGFLPGLESDTSQTRLDMARWIVSEENPLTARVAVNRFWGQMFEMGIVETQEDFGSSGSPPSHPQLLDDLAVRFRSDMNWSVKSLLREIALSSAYRQSAQVSAEALEKDTRNRLISRGSRKRLPAETVRDQALAISGLLSDELGGPPVHPPLPEGVWKPFQGGDRWATPETDNPDRYRRSVYTYTKRSIPFPMFASFDAPSREFCTPRRLPSNTPLQALMTLNDKTFEEASLALAKRMLEYSDEIDQQLAIGFELATCRPPQENEVQQLRSLYESSLASLDGGVTETESTESTEESVDTEQDAAISSGPELTAMSNVASVLLNLDEVLCK